MVTMETVAKALKTVYLGAIIEELNLKTDPFIARIHTSTDHVYGTNEIVRAAQIGLNGGFGAGTETGELPQPGEDVYANLRSTTKNLYGVIQMSDKSLKSFKGNDKNAFGNMIQRQIDSMMRTAKWHYARQVSGSHMGVLTTATGGTGNTVQVADFRKLVEGITIDVLTSAGAEVATKRRIKNINRNTGEILLDGTALGTVASGSLLVVQGSYGKELTGLDDIFDLESETLYGNERATNSWINPRVEEDAGAIDEVMMHRILSEQEDAFNVTLNYIRAGADAYEAYMKLLQAKTRIVNTVKLEGGAVSLKFNERDIIRDKFMEPRTIDFLDPDKFHLDQISEWSWIPGTVGGIFHQDANYPTYKATLTKYADLICTIPGGMARMTGVLDPVV